MFEVPPPEVKTVMLLVPVEVRSEAGIEAVNLVEETNVVVRFEPLNLTTEFETKLVPLTVIVKPLELITAEKGDIPVTVGTRVADADKFGKTK